MAQLSDKKGNQVSSGTMDENLANALNRISSRLDDIEHKMNDIYSNLEQIPNLSSIAIDSIDEKISQIKETGSSLDERIEAVSSLLERISNPVMINKVQALLDFAEQAPGLSSIAIDSVDETISKLKEDGIDINERLSSGMSLLLKLSEPEMMKNINGLISAAEQVPGLVSIAIDALDESMQGIDIEENLKLLGKVARSNKEAFGTEPEKVGGIFSIMRQLKDPSIQKSTSFLLHFLKAFGREL